jgi:hypothetical protein
VINCKHPAFTCQIIYFIETDKKALEAKKLEQKKKGQSNHVIK